MSCPQCGDSLPETAASCPGCEARHAGAGAPAGLRWVLVLALVGTTVVTGAAAWFWIILPALRDKSMVTDCKSRLFGIGAYCSQYQSRYGTYPPALSALYQPAMIEWGDAFICPQERGKRESPARGVPFGLFADRVSYEFRTPPVPPAGKSPNPGFVVAWDRVPHRNGKRVVLLYDGSVEELDQAAFERALAVR